jgi:hypothetical protein
LVGLLVGLGLALGRRRLAIAIATLLGLIVLVPALLEFIEAERFGFGWQGRYTLPLAVGLPILCGYTLAQEPARVLQRGRLTTVLGVAFVVAHLLAFWQNMRRYTVGSDGPLLFWTDADSWRWPCGCGVTRLPERRRRRRRPRPPRRPRQQSMANPTPPA